MAEERRQLVLRFLVWKCPMTETMLGMIKMDSHGLTTLQSQQ
ncbi:hypothetical protein PI125_g9546 [Phytophthora idaei]|nr:hypothetical protein PI125_g9546 [Phytophthora idaei]